MAVARFGSFTAAAERIGVAQPALSVQISKLEAELGCALLIRHGRGVELTPAGEEFLTHATEISEKIDAAQRETRLAAQHGSTELSLGIPTLMSRLLIAPLVEAIRSHLPGVTLRVREGMGIALRTMFASGQLDLVVVYLMPGEGFTDSIPLFEEDLYLGRLGRSESTLEVEFAAGELNSVPLILSSPGNSHREQLEYFARLRGIRLNIVAEVDSISGQRELVLKGAGGAVLPRSGFANWPHEYLQLARICEDSLISRALIVRSHKPRNSRVLVLLQNLIRELTTELINQGHWPGARVCSC